MAHFEVALEWIGANAGQIAQAKLLLGPFSYGKTYSRSVLGAMNDMKFTMEYMLKIVLGICRRLMTSFDGLPEEKGSGLAFCSFSV